MIKNMSKNISAIICIIFLSTSVLADIYDVPRVGTVQNRQHDYNSEFTLQGGYLPMDPYTKYLAYGGSYTYFFSDFTAWEIVNGSVANPLVSGLRTDLEENYTTPTTKKFDVLKSHITSNLSFTPLYTKNLLFNSSLVHSEVSFVAGGGMAQFSTGSVGLIDVGIILRYFISNSFAIKFDFRNYVYLSSIRNNLALVTGIAYIFGSKNDDAIEESDFED